MQKNEATSNQQPVDIPPKQPSDDSFSPAEEPIQEKKPNEWLIIGVATLVLILLGATGFFAYRYFQLSQQLGKKFPTPTSETTTTSSPLPSPRPTTDPTAGWKTYRNDKYGYEIKYPEGTVISESKVNEFSYGTDENGEPILEELRAVAPDKRFEYLHNKFTGKICVKFEYMLASISISAPINKERYVVCTFTGLDSGADGVSDVVEIEGQKIEISGFLFNHPVTNKPSAELYSFDLDNGTKITLMYTMGEDGTLNEWEETKSAIKQILSTLNFKN